MWSNKKEINIVINVLLFLLAINIFHYGQFILPIICLLLFIDNKFKLNIKNVKIFVLLCLFGVTFFLFSYKLGFYSVMGLCLPMAYYIGSNIKEPSEDNIKKIIYIIAFGMASHVVLNFIYDISIFGFSFSESYNHYDFWLKDEIKETLVAVNYVFIIGLPYYLIKYEKNKNNKLIALILFVLLFVYNFGLGRRTPVLLLIISLIVSLLLDIKLSNKINYRKVLILLCVLVLCTITICVIYSLNIFGLKDILFKFVVIRKFLTEGLKTERLELFVNALKLMPNHLWGGQEISNTVGIYIHDLWMDTYDFAGIIPYILLIIYSIYYLITMIKIFNNKNIKSENKVLFITLFVVITIQMFLDPIMSGSSIFLICTVLIGACFERLNNYEK